MTVKAAMEELISKGLSKYRIAKTMGMTPIMVDNFLTGKQITIRKEAADAIEEKYGVTISNNHINGYNKKMFMDKYSNN